MTAAISLTKISKEYPRRFRKEPVIAVNSLDLEINEGETFGFIGPNGAGKSTTIKILTGVLQPTAGSATLFGLSTNNPDSRKKVGYVPENPYLNDYLTPYEVLFSSAKLHQSDTSKKNILNWLEKLNLAHAAHKTIRSFSKGMTQRVAIAQALCIEPRLLILDEPLSGLDPVGRKEVVDLLAEYKFTGGTLFFTSHVLHDVERLANRFGLINKGQLINLSDCLTNSKDNSKYTIQTTGSTSVNGAIHVTGNLWELTTEQQNIATELAALLAAGHTLLQVKPAATLEKKFFELIE